MKKFLKILVLSILVIVGATFLFNFFQQKPFKFENFETNEEAQIYFNEHYPVGSDVHLLLDDLKKSGCECSGGNKGEIERSHWPKRDFEYHGRYGCDYYNNFISKDPCQRYSIGIYTDKKDKIVKFYIAKHPRWA